MSAFPIPSDERRRMRILERLGALDAPPDAFADAVAAAAASIAGAPIGAVTLVGREAMRVKASIGMPTGDVPRSDAFCSYVVMGADPFVIPDLRLDERFASNPLVSGKPHARFYAGFPLVIEGRALGAVCVIDDRPRTLSSEQVDSLGELARGAAAWFALRGTMPKDAT